MDSADHASSDVRRTQKHRAWMGLGSELPDREQLLRARAQKMLSHGCGALPRDPQQPGHGSNFLRAGFRGHILLKSLPLALPLLLTGR